MSTFESSEKSLLQGVSQQIPKERLPGQVTAQTNMMSDPVTNIRRRPGVRFERSHTISGAGVGNIVSTYTDLAGFSVHVLVNTSTGRVTVLDGADYSVKASLSSSYLIGTPEDFRHTIVGDEMFLLNCAKKPTKVSSWSAPDPSTLGFFYVLSGAFGRSYNITVGSTSIAYTTPAGSGADDSTRATPEYIASALVNCLKAGAADAVRIDTLPTGFTLEKKSGTSWVAAVVGDIFTKTQLEAGELRLNNTGAAQATSAFDVAVRVASTWYTKSENAKYTVLSTATLVLDNIYDFCAGITTFPAVSGMTLYREGAYVLVQGTDVRVSTRTGSAYLVVSKDGYVPTAGALPARLPAEGAGLVVRVGSLTTPQYYQYDHDKTQWLECGVYGSATGLNDMPVVLAHNGTTWTLTSATWEGRYAGDDKSNPDPKFLTSGITGLGTWQGRLVLLSGTLVNMSASGNAKRFYRSTVTSLLASDPIEVGDSHNSSSPYRWCLPFQKDLLLFSAAYQALIPSGNQAVSPTTATVVGNSTFSTDITSAPLALGRTVMFPTPRSSEFFGVHEMLPSPYTDSQYVPIDATAHIPKYMPGKCRFSVASTVSNMALFAPSGDTASLIVHEYLWNGDDKVQKAWHRWTFPYPVASAHFALDKVILVFANAGQVVIGSLDPKAGIITADSEQRPFYDLWTQVAISNNTGAVPSWMLSFDAGIQPRLKLAVLTGSLAGEYAGATFSGGTITTVPSHKSGTMAVGIPFTSTLVPTPPILRDYKDVPISTGKATLLRYMVGTKNSSEFQVQVSDSASTAADDYTVGTLTWSSSELQLGERRVSADAVSIVPCRTLLGSSTIVLSTDGSGEFNITSLEYVAKYNPKLKRR